MAETHALATQGTLILSLFLVKDRVTQGVLKIEYCPTEDMVVDFFTKPLQCSTFIKFKNQVMGCLPLTPSSDVADSHDGMKEHVEVEGNSMQT